MCIFFGNGLQTLFLSYVQSVHVFQQAHPIPPELTAKLLGNRVAVSPIVTVEPRRRKFHKPITLTIPVPQAAGKGMINQYNGETPTLRLLCSITGTSLSFVCAHHFKGTTTILRVVLASVVAGSSKENHVTGMCVQNNVQETSLNISCVLI